MLSLMKTRFNGIVSGFVGASLLMASVPAQAMPQSAPAPQTSRTDPTPPTIAAPPRGHTARVVLDPVTCRWHAQLFRERTVDVRDAEGELVRDSRGKKLRRTYQELRNDTIVGEPEAQCVLDKERAYQANLAQMPITAMRDASAETIVAGFKGILMDPTIPAEVKAEYAKNILERIIAADPAMRGMIETQMRAQHVEIDSVLTMRAIGLVNAYKAAPSPEVRDAARREIVSFTLLPGFGNKPETIMNRTLVTNGFPQGVNALGDAVDVIICRTPEGRPANVIVCGPASSFRQPAASNDSPAPAM